MCLFVWNNGFISARQFVRKKQGAAGIDLVEDIDPGVLSEAERAETVVVYDFTKRELLMMGTRD